jgi:hypothetical protein
MKLLGDHNRRWFIKLLGATAAAAVIPTLGANPRPAAAAKTRWIGHC